MEEIPEIGKVQKKASHWKYIIAAAVLLLCIFAGLIYRVITWTPVDSESRKASETNIRMAAAKELKKDPNDLTDTDFAKISVIYISRIELSDIKLLEKFINLKELNFYDISYPKAKIPIWMKILAKPGIFDLKKRFAIDLSPLENLTNLSHLNLSGIQVNDIKPLENLENMKDLILSNTQVNDISVLANLTNLQYLGISGTKVSSIRQLANLTELQYLAISGTKVSNIEPLANLTKLQSLAISDTKISNIEPIENLKNLVELFLDKTQVSDIKPLVSLKNLQELNISGTKVSDKQAADLQKALPNLKIER